MKPTDGALLCASMGWRVFPIRPGGKKPQAKGWQDWATCDRQKIESYATANPTTNWGVATGQGLFVLDIDTKETDGFASLSALISEHGEIPDTFRVSTTTGGAHCYFLGDGANSVNKLGDGLDTRGEGGYVVAPGSVIHGDDGHPIGDYKIESQAPAATAPTWIIRPTSAEKPAPVIETVVRGERNNALASFAGSMRSRGACYEVILAGIQAMNAYQTEDPVSDDELDLIARSISRYSPDAAAMGSELLNFQDQAVTDERNYFWASDVTRLRGLQDQIIKGQLAKGYITVTGAPPGAGKSRIAMAEGIAVATGEQLTGEEIRHVGPVINISEDPLDDMMVRAHGICTHNGIDPKLVPMVMHSMMDMDLKLVIGSRGGCTVNTEAADWLKAQVQRWSAILLILDPYSSTHSFNENDNMASAMYCGVLRGIATLGCAIHVVHHTAKGAKNTHQLRGNLDAIRGAGALGGAARMARTIDTYDPKLDKTVVVPMRDARRWVRMDQAKSNNTVFTDAAQWFFLESVRLPCHHRDDDSVGVAVRKDPARPQRLSTICPEDEFLGRVAKHMDAQGTNVIPTANSLADLALGNKDWEACFSIGSLFHGLSSSSPIYRKILQVLAEPREYGDYWYWCAESRGRPVVRDTERPIPTVDEEVDPFS